MTHRGHNHHALGVAVGVAALDVEELFGSNVGPKARFRHAIPVFAHLGGGVISRDHGYCMWKKITHKRS